MQPQAIRIKYFVIKCDNFWMEPQRLDQIYASLELHFFTRKPIFVKTYAKQESANLSSGTGNCSPTQESQDAEILNKKIEKLPLQSLPKNFHFLRRDYSGIKYHSRI